MLKEREEKERGNGFERVIWSEKKWNGKGEEGKGKGDFQLLGEKKKHLTIRSEKRGSEERGGGGEGLAVKGGGTPMSSKPYRREKQQQLIIREGSL